MAEFPHVYENPITGKKTTVADVETGKISQDPYNGAVVSVKVDSYASSYVGIGGTGVDNEYSDHTVAVSLSQVMNHEMASGLDSNATEDAFLETMAANATRQARTRQTMYVDNYQRNVVDKVSGMSDAAIADYKKLYDDGGPIHKAFKATLKEQNVYKDMKAVIAKAQEMSLADGNGIYFADRSDTEKNDLIEKALKKLRQDKAINEDGIFSKAAGRAFSNEAKQIAKKAAENEALQNQAANDVAKKKRQEDADKFNLAQKSGAWSNRNVLREHAWMLKTWLPNWLDKSYPMLPSEFPGPSITTDVSNADKNNPWVKYLFAATSTDAELFNSSLMAKVLMHSYVFIPPSLHALLVPKMELYVEFHNRPPKILRFDEHLSEDDLRRLMAGEAAEIPGVGLMSIDLEDKASNAAEIRKSYVMNLKVYTTNATDFTSKNDKRASFRDLWYNVNTKKTNGKPNNILRVTLGWKVPNYRSIMEAAGCSEQQAHDYRLALERNTLTYRLYLQNYNLSIQQNGAIEFEGTYQAAVIADIFNSDIFPMPINTSTGKLIKHSIPGQEEQHYNIREALKIIEDYGKSEETLEEQKRRVSDTSSEEAKEINQQLQEIQRKRQILRDQIKLARFSAFQADLLKDEKIYVVRVEVKDGKLSEKVTDVATEASDEVEDAARKAIKNAKSRQTNIAAVTYHNIATEEAEVHKIAYTHFGAIFESIVSVIMKNSGGGAYRDKRDFEFHFGKAEIRYSENKLYWCNVGLLPVPISRFTSFMQSVFAAIPDDESPFPFSRLFEMLVNDLLVGTLNSSEFFMPATGKNSERASRASLHKGHIRQYSMPAKYLDKLWAHPYKPTSTIPSHQAADAKAASYDKKNWAVLTGSGLQNSREEAKRLENPYSYINHFCVYSNQIRTLQPRDKVRDVYYIHIDSMAPVFLNGSLADNLSKGVHHFFLGSDTGMLKEISFAQKDIPGRQEAIMLSGSEGKQNILHFDATLKLMGNALFSNGDLIYIDPNLGRINSYSPGDSAGEILGMGGYYNVFKVNHSFSRDGYETSIEAKWNNFSGNRKPQIQAASSFYEAVQVKNITVGGS